MKIVEDTAVLNDFRVELYIEEDENNNEDSNVVEVLIFKRVLDKI